ncbi:hypothetical protein V8E55_005918 [Tylopilus felleus]
MDSEVVEQLDSRADALSVQFEQGEGTSYSDEAIVVNREALALSLPPHRKRSAVWTSLAAHLCARFTHFGVTRDLEEAIVLHREALDLCPQEHLDHLLRAMQDLDEANVLSREVL